MPDEPELSVVPHTINDKVILKYLADTLNSLGAEMIRWSHRLPVITDASEIEELFGFLAKLQGNAAGIHKSIHVKAPTDPVRDALVARLVEVAELDLVGGLDEFVKGQEDQ